MTVSAVSLIDAWSDAGAREFFLNTWPMYVHDLSAFDADFYRLGETGRWLPDLAGDWVAAVTPSENLRVEHAAPDGAQPFQRAHVILHAERPVGFACVGLSPFRYMPLDADLILAEFFLAHGSRGTGVAEQAAGALFQRYPGRWTLSVIHDNARAARFWQRTLPALGARDLRARRDARELAWDFTTTA